MIVAMRVENLVVGMCGMGSMGSGDLNVLHIKSFVRSSEFVPFKTN